MASGAKTTVTTPLGEDQARGGTVRPRSKSPTKRPTSPPNQPTAPKGSSKPGQGPNTSLRAPSQSAQSNSVPATPYVHARRYSNEQRTPSPISGGKQDGNASPRSVRSDSDSRVRPSGRALFPQTGCKFETGMVSSRRRIPYTIGGEMLEKAHSPIKEKLTPEEESQLSGEMRQLYEQRLLPTPESEVRRAKFQEKLERILNEQWPGNCIKVHVFGSSGNLLCTTESDVDVCITAPANTIGRVCNLAQCLSNRGMQRVVCIPAAKVPIVKIWDPEYMLACDMNVNNAAAIENTRLIRTYVEVDPRVRPLAMVVKYWTRKRILNDAGLGGTLSSYTWISLLIHYLQMRQPPILPSLQQRPHQRTVHEDGRLSGFADDLATLTGFGQDNEESLGDLLFGFFRYFGHEFDYENDVISIREGRILKKIDKKWHTMVNNRLCVEEPFNTDRNLGNTVDDYAFRGVHLEIRRAYDLLCEAKLDECCAEYEWPAIEAPFWQKPTPQPLPILSRSRSQTNRSTRSSESSGRNQKPRHRAAGSGRRASSAAASNKNNTVFAAPPGQVWAGDKSQNNSLTIHESLSQQMQLLQQQEAYYKLQMQQNAIAHSHAQTVAQVPNMNNSASPRQIQTLRETRRTSHVEPGPMSAPLRSLQSLQSAYFPLNGSQSPRSGSLTPGMGPSRGTGTNPSSPALGMSLRAPMDPRNNVQRPLTPDAADMARSRSQPPSSQRTVNGQQQRGYEQIGQALAGFPGLQHYQQQWMQAKRSGGKQSTHTPVSSPRLESLHLDGHHSEDQPLQEYVGYYVDNHGRQQQGFLMQQPNYDQERRYGPDVHRVKNRNSRSPSPGSTNFRDRSYSMQSARTAQSQQVPGPSNRTFGSLPTALSTPGGGGPIIIDGSGDSPEANPHSGPSSYYESAASQFAPVVPDRNSSSVSPSVDPFVVADEYGASQEEDIAVVEAPRNTVQFGEHEPRRLPSFAEHASALQRQSTLRAASQSSSSSAGWYDPASVNGLGIDVEPALAAAKDENLIASQQIPPHIANGVLKTSLSGLKPAPLLSPVREVRTPSPTTSRTNSKPSSSQGRPLHGRTVSLLSGQAAIQNQQQHIAAQEATKRPLVSGPKTASPKLTGQPFAAVVAQFACNGQSSSSRVSPSAEISRSGTPRADVNGMGSSNGSVSLDAGAAKPRQLSAPNSVSGHAAEQSTQAQSSQSGWQQATKRNKNKKKTKNHSISIPPDMGERKGG